MGKKNKKGSGEDPKENKPPPNDKKGEGSGSQPGGGDSGNQSGGKKKEGGQQGSKQQTQGGGKQHELQQRQQGAERGSHPQGASGGNKGPQQGGAGGQGNQQRQNQAGGDSQPQGAWGGSRGPQQGPQQRGPGGDGGQQRPQQGGQSGQGGRQNQAGGDSLAQGAWGGNRGPQQGQQQRRPGGDGGQQRPQQGGQSGQGVQRQNQGGGDSQAQGAWGGSRGPQQGPQQRGPGGDGGQQRPQQGGPSGQGGRQNQAGAWGGNRGPQQGQPIGDSQVQGTWGGNRGPQQSHGGQQQNQEGGGTKSQGAWGGNRGPQQGSQHQGGRGGQQHYRDQSQQSHGSEGSDGQQRQQFSGGRGGGRGGYAGGRGGGAGGRGGGGGGGQFRNDQQRGPQQSPADNTVVRVPKPSVINVPRGTKGYKFELQTNYILLNLDKMPDVAYHYDVKIDPDRPKKFIRVAFEAYVTKIFPKYALAYDGRANAYSPVLLPEDKLGSEITVEVDDKGRKIPFKVTVKATDDIEIDLKSLKAVSYHKERIFDKPMRALQCIEVVLSTPCHQKGVRAGRSFFQAPDNKIDLGDGFELWYGLYQAAMLCDQPLLNVDVSHKSFPSKIDLVSFYENSRDKSSRTLTDLLKGLRVTYKPPACFKSTEKEFKFVKVMDSSSRQNFKTDDGKQLTVEQYFQSKGYKLRRPDLPCLHVGSTVKNIYIPLEFLEVPPGQAIMRKDNENQVRQMIRHAATSTDIRKAKIMDLLRKFDFYNHTTVDRFGVSVGRSFITVDARLLSAPAIEYSKAILNIDRPGEWMNRNSRFYKCDNKIVHQWAIINISQKREINTMFLKEHFTNKISNEANKLGMSLSPQCYEIKEVSGGRFGPTSILTDLNKFKKNKISIVFVILPFQAESYAKVKQEAELSVGIVTQCIKGDTMRSYNKRFDSEKIIDQMTIGNILLKVNAKLNGTNHKISPANEIPLQKSKVMYVGADVSHPSPLQTNLPSIVGVVASHDLNGTQYNMQYRLQAATLEIIDDMKNIMMEHLKAFQKCTGCYPDNIIYYRDGVSDGQFPLIKQKEVTQMRAACTALKCNAKFTVIIVVKRHHTRFFPKGCDGEGKFNNVKAGTVVDQTICHPNEVQFFLVSHKAIQGTSKPTRYNVIIDDAKINIDDLQAMTYNLCHLFPRCNRSVSYPAPAYLAHLVGLRGRAYIEGSNLNLENLKAEYTKRTVSQDVMSLNPMYFV